MVMQLVRLIINHTRSVRVNNIKLMCVIHNLLDSAKLKTKYGNKHRTSHLYDKTTRRHVIVFTLNSPNLTPGYYCEIMYQNKQTKYMTTQYHILHLPPPFLSFYTGQNKHTITNQTNDKIPSIGIHSLKQKTKKNKHTSF